MSRPTLIFIKSRKKLVFISPLDSRRRHTQKFYCSFVPASHPTERIQIKDAKIIIASDALRCIVIKDFFYFFLFALCVACSNWRFIVSMARAKKRKITFISLTRRWGMVETVGGTAICCIFCYSILFIENIVMGRMKMTRDTAGTKFCCCC